MSFKLFKLTTVVLTSVTLSSAFLPLANISANTNTEVVKPANQQLQTSDDDIQSLDKYVTVVNNQFVLSVPNNANVSNELIVKAQEAINQSNQSITKNRSIINVNTKTVTPNPIFSSKAAWHSYYTYANLWWGTRYYFTSNAAVEMLAHDFDTKAAMITAGGIAATAVSAGSAVVLAGAGALYYSTMAANLRYYNSTHMQNQIYMDLNYAGVYDFHVLN